jgi:hypothetical protein
MHLDIEKGYRVSYICVWNLYGRYYTSLVGLMI